MNEFIHSQVIIPQELRPAHVDVGTSSIFPSVDKDKCEGEYGTPKNLEGRFSPNKTESVTEDPVLVNFQDIHKILDMLPSCASVDDIDVLNCPSFDFLGPAQIC